MKVENKYLQPLTIEEALTMAAHSENDFRFLAGGTDVMVNRFQENENSSCLIDLSGIDELKQVKKERDYLSIGALITLNNLKEYREITSEFPVLIEAADAVGSPLIRKSATLGGNILCENRCIFYNQSAWWRNAVGFCLKCEGNICIATGSKKHCYSEFVSDIAPALISMDALIDIVDKDGERRIKLEDLYTGDGVRPRNMSKTCIVKSILLRLNQRFISVFNKLRQRESIEFTSLTAVVTTNKHGKIKIVLGGVDPRPVVVEGTSANDSEELIKQAIKKSRAIDNEMFSRNYRREMAGVFLKRSFDEIFSGAVTNNS
ncbi:MAG TPA: FAD binding domain-containing protein [Saprospiraceae bacterium]|nr:FAD binding domain-containing protein [Saprospiraceae bacterium]